MPSPLASPLDPTASSAMAPQTQPNVYEQAVKQYPVLQDFGFIQTQGDTTGRMLESWRPGDKGWDWGGKYYNRPTGLPLDKPGLEVFSEKTRPIDLLGDAVSHHLVKTDPKLKGYYENFVNSITPRQQDVLQEQYQYSVQTEGEKRSFDEWAKDTGIPAMFRGYAFQQWPDDFNREIYTPEQRGMFDEMMQYLQGGR